MHGDIHMGNVLIFNEDGVIAKWTDFGNAYVSRRDEYFFNVFNPRVRERQIQKLTDERIQTDCMRFANVVSQIWKGRKIEQEHDSVRQLANRHMRIIQALSRARNLDEVYDKFEDCLQYIDPLI